MKLYEYYRSSASYRVRIALNLKGLAYDIQQVNLVADGGQQHRPEYVALNPQARVPSLVLDDGTVLTQSPAILEYLDEVYPEPRLAPADARGRARMRAIMDLIACDIHPLNNTSVLAYLGQHFAADQEAIKAWYLNWITLGFTALEPQLGQPFCLGAQLTLADVLLIPQIANARRFAMDLTPFPKIRAIEAACLAIPAFAAARPEVQPAAQA